jgi:hypothetical protein
MKTTRLPDPPHANGTTAKAAPSTNGTNGRQDPATGRFVKGNQGGPGNPHCRLMAQLRMEFLRALTPDKMAAFADKLHALALEGHLDAGRLLLRYSIGQPLPAVDPDDVDLHELQLLQQCNRETSLRRGTERIPADQAVVVLRALMASGLRQALADGALADVFVRQDVADALTAAGLGELVDQARVLRGRLK